ncbi:hypothetical protein WJX79_003577 [Trebouxia sp. C0005]
MSTTPPPYAKKRVRLLQLQLLQQHLQAHVHDPDTIGLLEDLLPLDLSIQLTTQIHLVLKRQVVLSYLQLSPPDIESSVQTFRAQDVAAGKAGGWSQGPPLLDTQVLDLILQKDSNAAGPVLVSQSAPFSPDEMSTIHDSEQMRPRDSIQATQNTSEHPETSDDQRLAAATTSHAALASEADQHLQAGQAIRLSSGPSSHLDAPAEMSISAEATGSDSLQHEETESTYLSTEMMDAKPPASDAAADASKQTQSVQDDASAISPTASALSPIASAHSPVAAALGDAPSRPVAPLDAVSRWEAASGCLIVPDSEDPDSCDQHSHSDMGYTVPMQSTEKEQAFKLTHVVKQARALALFVSGAKDNAVHSDAKAVQENDASSLSLTGSDTQSKSQGLKEQQLGTAAAAAAAQVVAEAFTKQPPVARPRPVRRRPTLDRSPARSPAALPVVISTPHHAKHSQADAVAVWKTSGRKRMRPEGTDAPMVLTDTAEKSCPVAHPVPARKALPNQPPERPAQQHQQQRSDILVDLSCMSREAMQLGKLVSPTSATRGRFGAWLSLWWVGWHNACRASTVTLQRSHHFPGLQGIPRQPDGFPPHTSPPQALLHHTVPIKPGAGHIGTPMASGEALSRGPLGCMQMSSAGRESAAGGCKTAAMRDAVSAAVNAKSMASVPMIVPKSFRQHNARASLAVRAAIRAASPTLASESSSRPAADRHHIPSSTGNSPQMLAGVQAVNMGGKPATAAGESGQMLTGDGSVHEVLPGDPWTHQAGQRPTISTRAEAWQQPAHQQQQQQQQLLEEAPLWPNEPAHQVQLASYQPHQVTHQQHASSWSDQPAYQQQVFSNHQQKQQQQAFAEESLAGGMHAGANASSSCAFVRPTSESLLHPSRTATPLGRFQQLQGQLVQPESSLQQPQGHFQQPQRHLQQPSGHLHQALSASPPHRWLRAELDSAAGLGYQAEQPMHTGAVQPDTKTLLQAGLFPPQSVPQQRFPLQQQQGIGQQGVPHHQEGRQLPQQQQQQQHSPAAIRLHQQAHAGSQQHPHPSSHLEAAGLSFGKSITFQHVGGASPAPPHAMAKSLTGRDSGPSLPTFSAGKRRKTACTAERVVDLFAGI